MSKIYSVCVYDLDKERCAREEKLLEQVLAQKGLPHIIAISNYGRGYISRAGIEDRLPAIEIGGQYWCRKPGEELTAEGIGSLLDMFIANGILS